MKLVNSLDLGAGARTQPAPVANVDEACSRDSGSPQRDFGPSEIPDQRCAPGLRVAVAGKSSLGSAALRGANAPTHLAMTRHRRDFDVRLRKPMICVFGLI
jgi:hypothetical protein